MKTGYTLFLMVAVAAGCSTGSTRNSGTEMTGFDKVGATHRALEKTILNYYRSLEEDVKKDLGVSETEIIDRVQALINDGYVEKPAILIVTEEGPIWERVDYATYKAFMSDRAVALRRYHGIQPNAADSLAMDSIRTTLLKALNFPVPTDKLSGASRQDTGALAEPVDANQETQHSVTID